MAANGHSDVENIDNSETVVLAVDTAGSANLRFRVKASISQDKPDFTAARSATNRWEYILVKDYQDGASINGDVGLVFSGTDDNRLVELNTNGLKWMCFQVDNWVAGSVSPYSRAYTTT